MKDSQHTIILGGGIAGLATGIELVRRGERVTILEKNANAGGLARTLVFDNFRFDIGGHRFHSNNPDVVDWVKDLLGPDLLRVPRISHIRMGKRYVDYPLQFPSALTTFSPLAGIRMIASYLLAQITHKNKPQLSFEDWVVARFGRALYDVYFGPYTQKVWGIPPSELSAAWAASRIGIPNLTQTILRLLRPNHGPTLATAITEFYYPRAGFGMITDRLQEEIEAAGSSVLTEASVRTVDPDTGTVTYEQSGQVYELQGDRIVSTIPLSLLLRMLPAQSGSHKLADDYRLEYRDIIIVDLALNRTQVSNDSWTYFPDPRLIFGRTHEPKNWSAEMVPSPEVTSLAVEIFTSRGEGIWEMDDDAIVAKVVSQMNEIGWINSSELIKGWVFRVPFAYPVYRVGYEEGLRKVLDFLKRWPTLHLVGRTGSFRYMNSDGVIEDVFRLMGELYPDKQLEVRPLEKEIQRWV